MFSSLHCMMIYNW